MACDKRVQVYRKTLNKIISLCLFQRQGDMNDKFWNSFNEAS